MAAGPRYIASAQTAQKTPLPTVHLLRVCCDDHVTATEPLPSKRPSLLALDRHATICGQESAGYLQRYQYPDHVTSKLCVVGECWIREYLEEIDRRLMKVLSQNLQRGIEAGETVSSPTSDRAPSDYDSRAILPLTPARKFNYKQLSTSLIGLFSVAPWRTRKCTVGRAFRRKAS
jgi:hypothetical protein